MVQLSWTLFNPIPPIFKIIHPPKPILKKLPSRNSLIIYWKCMVNCGYSTTCFWLHGVYFAFRETTYLSQTSCHGHVQNK